MPARMPYFHERGQMCRDEAVMGCSKTSSQVQEALVSAWKDMRALRDPNAWEAWLHRVLVRACYTQARRDRRRTQVELKVVPGPEPVRAFDLSVSIAEREALEQELGRLAIDQRTVMVLHYYADLTLEQAAEILDIPLGTAKSRLHRGLRTLRESMREELPVSRTQAQERTA